MKQIQFHTTGVPHEVVRCVNTTAPQALGPEDVQVRVAAFPINQADLLTLRGHYAATAQGPSTLGLEAVGEVVATGAAVERLRVGQRVILLGQQNWSEIKQVHWTQALAVPASSDLLQLAMLKVNPATATMLMDRFVALERGDWIVFNAASSGVGRSLIQLARLRGLRTVAVARRDEVLPSLLAHGADLALLDGAGLEQRIRKAVGAVELRLAADAIGGEASAQLLGCLADGGSLVCYGGLQGEPCEVGVRELVFRDLRVRGFWLSRTLAMTPYDRLVGLYADLVTYMDDGRLRLPVEAVYPIEAIAEAIEHAARSGHGKVLVTTPAYATMREAGARADTDPVVHRPADTAIAPSPAEARRAVTPL